MAGLSGAGAIAGSILNFVANERNNALQQRLQLQAQDWNAQQAAQANQWSIEQWNRENAYNDPSAQMQRLANAGINPALAYANGAFNQAASSPQVSTPAAARPASTQAWKTDPMMIAQLGLIEAQKTAIEHDTDRQDQMLPVSIQLKQEQRNQLRALSNLQGEMTEYYNELGLGEHERNKLIELDKEIKEKQRDILGFEYEKAQRTLESSIQAILDTNTITHENALNIKTAINLQNEQLRKQIKLLDEKAKTEPSMREYYEQLKDYYENDVSQRMESMSNYFNAMAAYWYKKGRWVNVEEFVDALEGVTRSFRNATGGVVDLTTGGKGKMAESILKPWKNGDPTPPPTGKYVKKNGRYYQVD